MSEADIDPHHGIPLASHVDDPLDGVSDPPSSSLSPQPMHFPGVDDDMPPRRPLPGPMRNTKYKSYKKKYNKIRHGFRDVMGRSNQYYDEEQKLERVARRLQEQNDQLLELLLDFNNSKRLKPSLRYDLRPASPSESAVPTLESDEGSSPSPPARYSVTEAHKMLEAAQAELEAGNSTIHDHQTMLANIRAGVGPAKPLALLEHMPHSAPGDLDPSDWPEELRDDRDGMLGYLSAAHEDDYLAAMEAGLDSSLLPLDGHGAGADRGNPASTYNWLRRNNTEYLNESSTGGGAGASGAEVRGGGSARGSPPAAGGTGRRDGGARKESGRAKRASAANTQELLDDMGYVIGEAPTEIARGSGKGKRKREDEPYRPKGGSGSRRRKPSEGGRPSSARKADP